MSEQAPEVFSKQAASRKIVEVATGIHADIVKKHRKPSMRFPIRSLANVKYDVKRGHFEILNKTAERTLSYNTVKTFAQSMRLLATTKNDLLDKDDIAGKHPEVVAKMKKIMDEANTPSERWKFPERKPE